MRSLLFLCIFIIGQTLLCAQDFNILDYGAKADGITLNTVHIQSAIDAAHENGGGRVLVPAGRFLSGSILLKSGVELHLLKDAVLLGSTNPEHYVKLIRWKALIMSDSQNNISITGRGEIDGQGRPLALYIDSLFYAGQIDSTDYEFPEMRPKYHLRPHLIVFVQCTDIKISNVTLQNSSSWVQTYDRCENLMIDSVRVESDAYWNNDGVDISDCRNVRITNCSINSADDGISLKSHSRGHSCDSIYIANCTVRSSASAIKLGARSYGGFRNVVIENIKVYDTFRSAVAIECVDGGTLENVLVDNIQAVNTGNALFIRLGKRNATGSTGVLKNVTIKNIRVEVAFERPDYAYEMRGPALPFFHNIFPSSITGIPGHPVENVILENIEIHYPGRGNNGLAYMPLSRLDEVPEKIAEYPEFSMFGELPAWGFYVRHVDGLTLRNIKLSIEAPDYRPALVFDNVRNLDVTSMIIRGDSKSGHIILYKTENVEIDNEQAVIRM
ncbi:MAG TPA: glycoside hydrolase family 28 protein [Saprospiraceae bacterium]|nr:glycoside hydrolase family 28 protein [Saprospiraceae bacterium]